MLKMTFENLGVLRHAEIELGDLTIICGKNNTGKTYAAYALYGFLKSWRQLDIGLIPTGLEKSILETRSFDINLQEAVISRWGDILKRLSEQYCKLLPEIMAASPDRFMDTRVHIDSPFSTKRLELPFEFKVSFEKGEVPVLSFTKPEGSTVMKILSHQSIATGPWSEQWIRGLLEPVFQDLCLDNLCPIPATPISPNPGNPIRFCFRTI